MIDPGCLDSGLVHGNHGTVGMSHQASVGSVAMASSVESRGGVSVDSTVSDGGSDNGTSSSVGRSLGSEVVSTGHSHSRLVSGDHSSVRVSDQMSVQVEGSGISVASSVAVVGGGSHSHWGSSVANRSGDSGTDSVSDTTELQCEVVGTGSCHSGLIYWDHSAIRVTDQTVETVGDGEGERGENLRKVMGLLDPSLCLRLR